MPVGISTPGTHGAANIRISIILVTAGGARVHPRGYKDEGMAHADHRHEASDPSHHVTTTMIESVE
jgi:hypothetical protein